ncbi:MAG: VWA domain-containing protein, partial [Hyphomicrobium sp.]|nr:VWA domain-containing protein [Hyphomicrobium sp.]
MCCVPPEAADYSALGDAIAARVSDFMRTLRANAFAVGLKEGEDAARIATTPLAQRPTTFRAALKAVACARRSDWQKFDDIFDAFWLGRGMRRIVPFKSNAESAKPAERRPHTGAESEQRPAPNLGDHVSGEGADSADNTNPLARMEGASRAKRLAETDFRKIHDPEAIAEAHALAARLARAMRTRLSRRERAHLKGRRLDLRRTIRRNISHGGVPIELMWHKK